MVERTVMQAGFAYWADRPLLLTEDGKPTRDEAVGFPVLDERGDPVVLRCREFAVQGETVVLSEGEAERGDALGVFTGAPLPAPAPAGGGMSDVRGKMSDVRGKSVGDLVQWLESEQPGVKAAVAACQGDTEALSALLEAYKRVTDGEPPATLVKAVERAAA